MMTFESIMEEYNNAKNKVNPYNLHDLKKISKLEKLINKIKEDYNLINCLLDYFN